MKPTDIPRTRKEHVEHLLSHLYDPITAQETANRIWEYLSNQPVADQSLHNDCMLITYADTINAPDEVPLHTLNTFLRRWLPDVCGRVHILPFYPSSSDDGFAVIDYRMVDHHVGGWEDIETLAEQYDLMFDLVINHCSRENLWFADFVSAREPGKNYFITLSEETDVSAVSRPRSTPLISGVHTYSGIRHVWNTFSDDQIDLDFENPDVLIEFIKILGFYAARGAKLIRLDAVGYVWKRLGTSCLNLPEAHIIVKVLRMVLEEFAPAVMMITETNVPHEENIAYFGNGDEAHYVYQFSLPPLLLYSLVFGNTAYLKEWATNLETPPPGASYLNFIASHDGIGLRPLEGLVPEEEVERLVDCMHERGGFVTLRDAGNDVQRPYEINISLLSAFGGAHGLPAFLAAHAIALSFQGSPAIYIHSMLGTENDLDLVEQTGRTRSINRKKWQAAELNALLENPETVNAQALEQLSRLIKARNQQPALAAQAGQRILETPDTQIAIQRICKEQSLLIMANVCDRYEHVNIRELGLAQGSYPDRISGAIIAITEQLVLQPYQVVWLDITGF